MIYILSATNRPDALTKKIAENSVKLFNEELMGSDTTASILDLANLKLDIFEQSSYSSKPDWFVEEFQKPILNAKGLYVITPEYNGSFPGVMKYFIDMLKFPESLVSLPVAFTGVAAGQFGALRSVEQLEILFQYRKAHIFGERLFIPNLNDEIKEDGSLPKYRERQVKQIKGFIEFVKGIKG